MVARELDQNRLDLMRAIEDIDAQAVLRLLAENTIDLETPIDGNGKTFLLQAVENFGPDEIMDALLEAGANPNQPNSYGTAPLHLAAQLGASVKIMQLVKAGAELNQQDKNGETALHRAANCKRQDDVQRLLNLGVDSDIANIEGKTAEALAKDAPSILKMLQDNQSPPLLGAAEEWSKDALLAQNDKGLCALDAGISWRRIDKLLDGLEQGGAHLTRDELMQQGKEGKTYLQRAVENKVGSEALRHMHAHGERLETTDLVQNGQSTELLDALVKRHAVQEVFTRQMWEGRGAEEMASAFRAMPEEGKKQVGNYFTLRTALAEEARGQQAGRGR